MGDTPIEMGGMSESPQFRSLELGNTPWTRWAWSFAVNTLVVFALIAIPVTVHHVIQPPNRTVAITLVTPTYATVPKPRPIAPPTIPKTVRRAEFHAPLVKPPEVKTVVVPLPPVEVPKPIEVPRVDTPKIDPPARPPVVFSAAPEESVKPQVKPVITGGFGNPSGALPAAASSNPALTAPKVGAFDAPTGQGSGPAKARVVASAGFGSSSVAEAGANGHAPVRGAGFGDYDAAPRTTQASRTSAPVETPVEITFKPKPAYTSEAREKKVEGEVQLEVVFTAAGQIRVLRVLRGLGFGLDENARAAAGQIRFHPGMRNGSAVDVTGVVHIVFELS
jgi:TonB family protein